MKDEYKVLLIGSGRTGLAGFSFSKEAGLILVESNLKKQEPTIKTLKVDDFEVKPIKITKPKRKR